MKENVIRDKSYSFALQVIALYSQLCKNGEYVLSKQLLRSATSIGANVEEAQAAQSKADFVAKMSIASKEARETNYWLRLLRDSEICTIDVEKLLSDSESISNILTAIIKSSSLKHSKSSIQNSESKIQHSKSSNVP
ncbi:four helix bundle protein [Trichlorobacter lovleyi]|uniref:four helix bundle protein n=1 Tax=Trichlorobacter lovleyi TaxID=313985 RepID=UPI00247FFEB0|nr:four helix bundle protein [Trichlorobacter lovleyi]